MARSAGISNDHLLDKRPQQPGHRKGLVVASIAKWSSARGRPAGGPNLALAKPVAFPSELLILRNRKPVSGVVDPLLQPGDKLLAFSAEFVVVRHVNLLVRIIVEVEHQPGSVFKATVFPAVQRDEAAPCFIHTVGMAGRNQ